MYRDILTNKWTMGSLVFLIIFAGLCYFYYQYTIAPYREETAKLDQIRRQSEKQRIASIATSDKTTEQSEDAQVKSTRITAEKSINETKNVTASEAPAEKTEAAEVRVSPFGFGPYPEVPEDFIQNVFLPSWIVHERYGMPDPDVADARSSELICRVLIKLWKEGDQNIESGFIRNGRVYVNYNNRAYVRYKTVEFPDGTENRVIVSWTAGSLKAPSPDPENPFQSNSSQTPTNVELIDLDKEDPGIDPYEFLGLP